MRMIKVQNDLIIYKMCTFIIKSLQISPPISNQNPLNLNSFSNPISSPNPQAQSPDPQP